MVDALHPKRSSPWEFFWFAYIACLTEAGGSTYDNTSFKWNSLREITSFWLEESALCFPSSLRKYFSFSLKINHMTLNPPFWKPTRSPCFISWVPTGVRCCVWRLPGLAGSLWELSASGSCRRANSGCWTSGSQSGPMSVALLDVFHQCVYAGSFFYYFASCVSA